MADHGAVGFKHVAYLVGTLDVAAAQNITTNPSRARWAATLQPTPPITEELFHVLGSVESSVGAPLQRLVVALKKSGGQIVVVTQTLSEADGTFDLGVPTDDKHHILYVPNDGTEDKNVKVYGHVQPA